jgi:glutamate-ammonia-ligase adenylyltransferase
LRETWAAIIIDIAARDAAGEIETREAKGRQTLLAEASINTALRIAAEEMKARHKSPFHELPLAIMGLGKLGGAGIDYDSDLDIIAVYDDTRPTPIAATEFYARAVEIFVNALSGITREGSLYRVDLRLRPHGKNGPNCISARSFAQYVREDAAVWELLAFLKIRAAGGDVVIGETAERDTVSTIFDRSACIPREELGAETLRIRRSLEKQRTGTDRRGVVDIKYGPGGMLDVYFAIRYLQLRDGVPDDPADRSSDFVLSRLLELGSLTAEHHAALLAGYRFISELDHSIRLTIGRTTKLPAATSRALIVAAKRLGLSSPDDLLRQLSLHRIAIRESFSSLVSEAKPVSGGSQSIVEG